MHRQRYGHGRFRVRAELPYADAAREFITSLAFRHYESQRLVPKCIGRSRNSLYSFYFPPADKELVMKVSNIRHEPSLSRRIDLFLTGLIKDYNHVAYKGALALEAAGMNTGRAVAWWTYRPSRFAKQSYFLYEKVDADCSVGAMSGRISDGTATSSEYQAWGRVIDETVNMLRRLHRHGVRHGDLQGANLLVDLGRNVQRPDRQDLPEIRVFLIDTDHVSRAWIKQPVIKRFFDLNCLRRAHIDDRGQQHYLRRYLGEEYREAWWWVLKFWNAGGFRINRWLRRRGKVA